MKPRRCDIPFQLPNFFEPGTDGVSQHELLDRARTAASFASPANDVPAGVSMRPILAADGVSGHHTIQAVVRKPMEVASEGRCVSRLRHVVTPGTEADGCRL